MNYEVTPAALAAWAARELPARLDTVGTAKLLGFAEHDIQILMSTGKLVPLGEPAPNAPKWFAAVELIRLAGDRDWLHKATKDISKYWRNKRERREPVTDFGLRKPVKSAVKKVTPDSSPEPSLKVLLEGNEQAGANN